MTSRPSSAARRSRSGWRRCDIRAHRRPASPQAEDPHDGDTVALLERLAVHYDDATIAGILNRQGPSATGEPFTAQIVGGVRRYRHIPRHDATTSPPDGELVPIAKAAEILGFVPSTVHRWLRIGFM